LTPIQVDSGFVAPLHLLTGLLTKVQEDWPRALAQLGGALARVSLASDSDGKIEPELRLDHFQAFEFSCWVLWGPSIPLCPCPMWSRENRVLQYGFGDESNSFQLLVDSEILWEQLVREFKDVGRPYPLAAQLALTATPMWWAKPYDIIDNPMWHPADASASNQNGTGSLLLRAETAHIVKDASSSVQYYSAYLWIMFEICDATGRLDWFQFGDWRRYLPIFEHTNIADGSTLTMLKELLAQKAITLIKDLEEMFLPEGGGPPDVYFRYVAAVDDPGGNNTHSVKLRFGGADQGLTLREWLEKLADEELRQRLMSKQVAPETPARPQNACYFPILVDRFSPTNGS
jgi:hypothetical protein